MRKNKGFSNIVLLIFLALGLIVAVFLIGRQTGFFNRAGNNPLTNTNSSPWINAGFFDGESYAITNTFSNPIDLKNQFTLEGWFWADPTDPTLLTYLVTSPYNDPTSKGGFKILLSPRRNAAGQFKKVLDASITINDSLYSLETDPDTITDSTWHHFAFVRDDSKLSLFLDGKLAASRQDLNAPTQLIDTPISFGALLRTIDTVQPQDFFAGQMEELVLSDIARYKQDFSVPMLPRNVDQNTVFLYHFDYKVEADNPHRVWLRDETSNYNAYIEGAIPLIPSTLPFIGTTHTECVNNACVQVNGVGKNSCSTNIDCAPKPILNLLVNGGFELDTNPKDNLADSWIARRLDKNDGLTPTKYEGKSSFRFSPYDAAANAKKDVKNELIRQVVTGLKGQAKDTITLEFWDRITNFNRRDGNLAAAIVLKLGTKIISVNGILINTSTQDWKKHVVTTEAQGNYDAVVVNFYNTNTKAAWWLDAASLTVVPNGVAAGIKPTASTLPTDILQALQEN